MHLWQRRILGVLALGGSFLGLALGLMLLPQQGPLLAKVFVILFLALYCWGIWCGVMMLEASESAVRSNLWFWAVQIPLLQSPYFGYAFASGALTTVTFQPATAKFDFLLWLGSKFEYSLLQSDKPFVLGINLFALVIVGWLWLQLRGTPSNNSFKPKPLRGSA